MSDIIASSEGPKEKIQAGSRVTLHFALLMPSGEEIDTTRRGKPASLTLGDGNLLPGFEEVLIGLAAGDDDGILRADPGHAGDDAYLHAVLLLHTSEAIARVSTDSAARL